MPRKTGLSVSAILACLLLAGCAGLQSAITEPELTQATAESGPPDEASLPAGVDLPRLQRALAEREYQVSRNGRGLQAPNRAHDLRTYFDETGIRVHDRTAEGSPELLALALVASGRGAHGTPALPGELVHDGSRVEIRREGLTEWYENSAAGLEQGFTLAARTPGDGELWLELSLVGAHAKPRGEGLEFMAAGRRLRYEIGRAHV